MGPFIEVTSSVTNDIMYIRADLIAQILPTKDTNIRYIHLNIKGDRPVISVTDTITDLLNKYNKAREEINTYGV